MPAPSPRPDVAEDVATLVADARKGKAWAVGRLLSWTERPTEAAALARTLPAHLDGASAHVVGLTGPPGAGKSTLASALVAALRADDLRVAVLAVDPSSPYSGGALLGDRTRLRDHATDPAVLIRSMSSRGRLGGLSAAVPQALQVLEVVGFDVVLLETVGVGQSEVDVARSSDTVVVVSAPGMGDELQAAKAGVLEVADVYAVNKSDHDGAAQLVRQLRRTASLARSGASRDQWRRPVVTTVAATGTVAELLDAIRAHHRHLVSSGERAARRRERARTGVRVAAVAAVEGWFDGPDGRSALDDLAVAVGTGEHDQVSAAHAVLHRFHRGFRFLGVDEEDSEASRRTVDTRPTGR